MPARRRPDPPRLTVDVAAFTIEHDDLAVLLVQRAAAPFKGLWALPGGFLEGDESLEDAAARELAEETAITGVRLEQLATYGDPGRDPRGRTVTVAYVALVPPPLCPRAGDDAADARLWSVAALPELAFDHARIVADATERVRAKLEYTDVALAFVPDTFTLPALRRVYEVAWGRRLEPKSFRRKIFAAGLVETVDARERNVSHRPAQFFRAVSRRPGERVLYPPFRPPDAE